MIEVFGCIILTAFFVNGLTIATNDGMILEFAKLWLKEKLSYYPKCNPEVAPPLLQRKIYKPLIGCVRCMPSIYGTVICLCFLPFNLHLLYIIPVVIACSSTLAAIIYTQYV